MTQTPSFDKLCDSGKEELMKFMCMRVRVHMHFCVCVHVCVHVCVCVCLPLPVVVAVGSPLGAAGHNALLWPVQFPAVPVAPASLHSYKVSSNE